MIVVLAGGVGAARFLEGLAAIIAPERIVAVVNTGDDMIMHGLHISPDLDIVTCTLAGVIDRNQGWGIAGDTDECMQWLGRLGAPTWFKLGDRDLALHIYRTARLRAGATLSQVTDEIRRALGVGVRIVPMSDEPAPTHVITDQGELHFEEYFVRERCQPTVRAILLHAAGPVQPAPELLPLLTSAEAIIIAPSNPVVSIGPILAIAELRTAIATGHAPVVAISPIVGGAAIKGPAVPLMRAVGLEPSALGVAEAYIDVIDGIVIDTVDAQLASAIEARGIKTLVTDTIMRGMPEKMALARATLELAGLAAMTPC